LNRTPFLAHLGELVDQTFTLGTSREGHPDYLSIIVLYAHHVRGHIFMSRQGMGLTMCGDIDEGKAVLKDCTGPSQ
jgi:hypothetical protein